jgi:hypothetical protein
MRNAILIAILAAPAAAQEGDVLLYHYGFLLNADDTPFNGNAQVALSLYSTKEGGSADRVWNESYEVSFFKGGYAVILGDTRGDKAALHAADLAGERWLDVKVGDQQLLPRIRIGTVPHAIRADEAAQAANAAEAAHALDADHADAADTAAKLGTLEPADVALASHTHAAPAWTSITGRPAGLDDGDDNSGGDITSVAHGAGLTGGGDSGDVSLAVDFNAVAAASHNHDAAYLPLASTGRSCTAGDVVTAVGADGKVTCTTPLQLAGSGSATTAAKSDHKHDVRDIQIGPLMKQSAGTYTASQFSSNPTATDACGTGYHVCNAWEYSIFGILFQIDLPDHNWLYGGFPEAYHMRSLVNIQDNQICSGSNLLYTYPKWCSQGNCAYGRVHCTGDTSARKIACCRDTVFP